MGGREGSIYYIGLRRGYVVEEVNRVGEGGKMFLDKFS